MKALDYEFNIICSNKIRATYGPDVDIWALAGVGAETLKARGFRRRDIKDIMEAAANNPKPVVSTPLPETKWRPLYALTVEEKKALDVTDRSREKVLHMVNVYHDRLEAELKRAMIASKNLAVSPLLGNVVEGLRYEFVQCNGTYPVPGWTTYMTGDYRNDADAIAPASKD